MRKSIFFIFLIGIFFISIQHSFSQQRFPKPEFETGYEQPSPETPEPRSSAMEVIDLIILIGALSLASWLALKKRSRRGILWLSVFTLLYFGFYREGCICSVGSVQNMTLAIFDPAYKISITVLLFFLLPLVFALFFGRTFCAGACPLGAIQDILVIRPISVPVWINRTLGFIPYLYLGFAVLFAATGTEFIICRYDPFVGFFRMDAPFLMVVIGIALLLLGLFFARPYCRVLCPYGVLLSWMSRFSKWHLSITPAECISCKLCENSCPFDAIEKPVDDRLRTSQTMKKNLNRFILFGLLVPVWMFITGYAISSSHVFLSKAHPDVYLAELLITHPELKADQENLDIQAFLESGQTFEELVENASLIREKFKTGGWYLGGFLGLVIGVMIMNQFIFRKREDYSPHKADCLSCGRCMDYCPVVKLK